MTRIKKQSGRNGKIEFLRFVFCIIIAVFHGKSAMTDDQYHIMYSGRIGVEFYFLVSGYFMAAAAEKVLLRNPEFHLGDECSRYLLRKYQSMYPMVFLAFFMNIFVRGLLSNYTLMKYAKRILNCLPSLFLIQQTGLHISSINGFWYLSSMLIAMAVLYPLLLRHNRIMKRVGTFMIGIMLLGYLMLTTNDLSVRGKLEADLLINRNIRAIAVMSMGAFSYEMVKLLSAVPFNRNGRVAITLTEAALYIIAVSYMMFLKGSKYDYYIVFVLWVAVTLSFSNVPLFSNLFNNRLCYFLGKFSFYVYLSHSCFALDLTPIIGPSWGNKARMIVFLLLAFFMSGILWILSNFTTRMLHKAKYLFISPIPEQTH